MFVIEFATPFNMIKNKMSQRVKNLSLAAVAAQAGCWTLFVVFGALFLGLWLDAQLGLRGPCIFGTLILSIPVSLYGMLRIALGAIQLISVNENKDVSSGKEED
ncbi:MAG: hypothetical protein CUN56_02255 [Phototrophicales bacterium]|nr:MAG: hypothetical protein CUN56_02255 [Phototrophicales bacterium]RMG77823.1 MAG: hypothetical protein D6711_00595 [Chloroflexota bacterium]